MRTMYRSSLAYQLIETRICERCRAARTSPRPGLVDHMTARPAAVTATIDLMFREMAEQVAIRLRRKKKKTQLVSIHASYSKIEGLPSIHCQQKIEPTQSTKVLSDTVLRLFRSKYEGGAIRQIGVFYGELVEESLQLFSLFDDPIALEKEEKLQQTIDRIRDQFGFASLQKGSSLLENSRAIARSKLTGGHSAGGLDGLT